MAEKMKIAMSLLSGVGYGSLTYFRGLIPALAKIDKVNEYHLFIPQNSPLVACARQDNFFFHECLKNNKSALMRFLWEQLRLPKELKKRRIDIMFTAKNITILFAPCKTVIAIQNIQPLCYTRYRNHWRINVLAWLRGALTKVSIRTADRVIAVSQSTKQHIEHFSPHVNDKVDVVYNGNPVRCESPKADTRAIKEPFILTSSKFVAYANQASLIDGYALLMRQKPDTPPLWIAGGVLDKDYFKQVKKQIQAYGLEDKVKMLGLVSHQHLIELYSNALAFVFPSTLEACPQTLIEAMACGVPIAASNVPPMPEICGDAAIYFEPSERDDIAEKIDRVISDESLRNTLMQRSVVRSRFFSWTEIAQQMVSIFEKVCRHDFSVIEGPITSKS